MLLLPSTPSKFVPRGSNTQAPAACQYAKHSRKHLDPFLWCRTPQNMCVALIRHNENYPPLQRKHTWAKTATSVTSHDILLPSNVTRAINLKHRTHCAATHCPAPLHIPAPRFRNPASPEDQLVCCPAVRHPSRHAAGHTSRQTSHARTFSFCNAASSSSGLAGAGPMQDLATLSNKRSISGAQRVNEWLQN